jgi:hypothetical protein
MSAKMSDFYRIEVLRLDHSCAEHVLGMSQRQLNGSKYSSLSIVAAYKF